jgi:DNA invertase Pin-like site-specific DNA recombinase/DNA-directed RNA polymerase subunit RPC12/RpoP
LEKLSEEVRRVDGEIVKTYDLVESAASMERDSLEEIRDLAEDDKIDVLGVWKLDRLTRASPWDTLLYLNQLREEDVILYAHTHGYFEWDDLYDFEMLTRRVVFAREWRQRIVEGGREGQVRKLEQKKWPFGATPHGYTTDEDQFISLTEKGEEINHDIVQLYLECESMKAVHDEINDRYEESVSESQISNILQNPLLAGELTLKNEVVAVDEDLQVIDRETFEDVQKIRERNSSASSNTRDIPEAVDRAAHRFGVEYVLEIIDSIDIQCRKCGSDLRKNGTTERWGTTLRKYACVNKDCGYEGPLLKQTEFDDIHQTLPLRCPLCPGTNRFRVENHSEGSWEFTYECSTCGTTFGLDSPPGKLKRAMENSEIRFRWDQATGPSESEQNISEGTSDPDGTGLTQKDLNSF